MERIEAVRTGVLTGNHTGAQFATARLNEGPEPCRSPRNSVWFRSAASTVLQQFIVNATPPVKPASFR